MPHVVASDVRGARFARLALKVAAGTVAAFGVGFAVWSAGFDVLWSVATTLAVGSVGGVIAAFTFGDSAPWDPPARTTPRATGLAVVAIEQSLAACDRLARPRVMRRIRDMLIPERDDRLARAAVVRQMRALLVTELLERGIDPSGPEDDVVALLNRDALAVLQPHDDNPVTSAVVARCLDAIDRLANANPGSR